MPITQILLTSNATGGGGGGGGGGSEAGTPGSSVVWESSTVPTSGSTWLAGIGDNATIAPGWSINASGGVNGILTNSGYINIPINLNQGHWTVDMVCSLVPTSYWAAIWGNESYSSQLGYLAYLNGPMALQVGSPAGTVDVDLTTPNITLSTRAHWAFTNIGGVIAVYRNGVQLTVSSGYVAPSNAASTNLFIGSRHNNDGIGATDACNGTYYYVRVHDYGLDEFGVLTAYDTVRNTYGV
jgi:hypothetical protein